MAPYYIRDLFAHEEWADALIWSAVVASDAALADEAIAKKIFHIHTVQRAFLQIWRGEPIEIPPPESFAGRAAVGAWGRETHAGVAQFLKTVDDELLSRALPIPWSSRVGDMIGRPPAAACVRDMLIQVPMHSGYHRGQVSSRIREVGGTPPLADYIAWIWMGRPAAAWPAAIG
jgi:uncharacterized damage-inducible protein DinB